VTAALRPAPPAFPETLSVAEAYRRASDHDLGSWPVANDAGLVGIVRLSDIARAVSEGRGDEWIGALVAEITDDDGRMVGMAHLHPDQPLSLALARMGETGHSTLPVVSRANAHKILGIVTLVDILEVYGVGHATDAPTETGEPHASA
jgi:CBS domain-containing protein